VAGIYERFQQLFLLLPLFAVIEQQIFVVHGGLFRTPEVPKTIPEMSPKHNKKALALFTLIPRSLVLGILRCFEPVKQTAPDIPTVGKLLSSKR